MNPGTTGSYFCKFLLMKKACKLLWFIDLTQTPPQISPARLGAVEEERLESWIGEYHELKCHMMNQINIYHIYIYTYLFSKIELWKTHHMSLHCDNNTQVWGSLIRKGTRTTYTILSTKDANQPHTRLTTLFLQPKCNMTIVVPDHGG